MSKYQSRDEVWHSKHHNVISYRIPPSLTRKTGSIRSQPKPKLRRQGSLRSKDLTYIVMLLVEQLRRPPRVTLRRWLRKLISVHRSSQVVVRRSRKLIRSYYA